MRRLSRSVALLKDHYQVVVVGSGYGGAVAASRLARAGRSVCLLERGKEFLPGEFPDTLTSASGEFQLTAAGKHIGCADALYDLRIHEDMNVFVGCGLGGTSLVNANVSIEPSAWVLQQAQWPAAIRAEAGQVDSPLRQGYQRAREMLQPTPYPAHYPPLAKTAAHQQSAEALNSPFYLTDINVNFAQGVNPAGVEQPPCNNCGDCVSGCNVGAKNTTAMNYLPDAANHGAEIFCQAKVDYIERVGSRWRVYFQSTELNREVFNAPPLFVIADQLVLAAGTLGSSEILLRSRDRGLSVSHQLGRRFTGNGDVLAFAYNCDVPVNGIGFGDHEAAGMEPVGPCITSVIDARQQPAPEHGTIIEEGSLPGLMASVLPGLFSAAAAGIGRDSDSGFWDAVGEKLRTLKSLVRGARHGAVANSQTYLVMGHDDANGQLRLDNNQLQVHWPEVGRQPAFARIADQLQQATVPLGGTYIPNPMWNELLGHDLVTVHPLGGCAMADDASQGVVNDRGQVFSSADGNAVYDNLYVCDGAVIPSSLGVNPLLTITALAERSCLLMTAAEQQPRPNREHFQPSPQGETAGIQFTETMRGFFSRDSRLDFLQAQADGKAQGQGLAFTLTVVSDDVEALVAEPDHCAAIFGTVEARSLSTRPLMAVDGQFSLLIQDPDRPGQKLMDYRMRLVDENGRNYFFHGQKHIHNDPGFDLWDDTTTLFVTLYEGPDQQAPVYGRGVLHILPADFARQMTTMRARNARDVKQAAAVVAKFGHFFAGSLAENFGGPFAPFKLYDPLQPGRVKRQLNVGEPRYYPVQTEDGVDILLTRYCPEGGSELGAVMLSHGLGVSSKIFSLDTIDTNLLEYLYGKGFDVWLLDYRASIELPAAMQRFNGDDVALYDYPAAVEKIRAVTGEETIQVVAHCFGACTFTMAMLAGLKGVRSAILSQVSSHYEAPLLNKLKAGFYLPSVLDALGIDSLTAYRDSQANWLERLMDDVLRLYPQQREELNNNPVDKRVAFLYGQLWELDQLNALTHDNLHELFGVANIEAFEHLALMIRKGFAVAADGSDSYLPHVEKMAMPIRFIHGQENATFLPGGAEKSLQFLRDHNGSHFYDLKLIPEYGHIDCIFGRNAIDDVYPFIAEHLQKYARS